MRLAITREEEGGREVPVPRRVSGRVGEVAVSSERVRLKKSVGTDPQVSGPTNVAVAELPGWRKRSNLWTSLGVVPPWEKRGLIISLRGPHCMIISSFDLMGTE